jgi:hypothetical protein
MLGRIWSSATAVAVPDATSRWEAKPAAATISVAMIASAISVVLIPTSIYALSMGIGSMQ